MLFWISHFFLFFSRMLTFDLSFALPPRPPLYTFMNCSAIDASSVYIPFTGTHGISFAIPIDPAVQVIKQLIANRRVIRPHVGMVLCNYNETTKQALRTGDLKGVYNTDAFIVLVSNVEYDSPAFRAGIRRWVSTLFSLQAHDLLINVICHITQWPFHQYSQLLAL